MQIGLVDQVVAAADLLATAHEAIGDIVSAAPVAVAGMRAAIRLLEGAPSGETTHAIEQLREAAFASAQFREGLAAFRERRSARWEPTVPPTEPSL